MFRFIATLFVLCTIVRCNLARPVPESSTDDIAALRSEIASLNQRLSEFETRMRGAREELARLSYLELEKTPTVLNQRLSEAEQYKNKVETIMRGAREELARLSYLELEKNPTVREFIPTERLRRAVAEEKVTLYLFTEQDFRLGNQSN